MNILAYEADYFDRQHLRRVSNKAAPEAKHCIFDSSDDALEFAKENPIDAAFIDFAGVHTPEYFLFKGILKLQKTNIIFTNYEWEHLREASKLRVSGFIRKPLR